MRAILMRLLLAPVIALAMAFAAGVSVGAYLAGGR